MFHDRQWIVDNYDQSWLTTVNERILSALPSCGYGNHNFLRHATLFLVVMSISQSISRCVRVDLSPLGWPSPNAAGVDVANEASYTKNQCSHDMNPEYQSRRSAPVESLGHHRGETQLMVSSAMLANALRWQSCASCRWRYDDFLFFHCRGPLCLVTFPCPWFLLVMISHH